MKDNTTNTYKLIYKNQTDFITSFSYLKRKEAELKGLRANFSIEYPDGYKVHYEALK